MELNFKLAVHHTSLGEYKSQEELISAIEELVEGVLEGSLKTEIGVSIEHEETPIAYFSCVYEKGDKEVIIPLATKLRNKEEIQKHLSDYGYAPDKYKFARHFNITESQYFKYCRNRHPDDPMKSEMGKDMKYYGFYKGKELVTYIASRRTFKSENAVLAYAIEIGKISEHSNLTVKMDVPKEEYFHWKYGAKYGNKNVHYIAHETYNDGRDPEYFAYLATKLKFKDISQVKSHLVEMGKLKTKDLEAGIVVEQCNFDTYKLAKKTIETRLSKVAKTLSDSKQEEWEYSDDEEYEDD